MEVNEGCKFVSIFWKYFHFNKCRSF